jgi:hypothetical protein
LIPGYSPGAGQGGDYAQATAALAGVFEVSGIFVAGAAYARPLAALIDHFDPHESAVDRQTDRKYAARQA